MCHFSVVVLFVIDVMVTFLASVYVSEHTCKYVKSCGVSVAVYQSVGNQVSPVFSIHGGMPRSKDELTH